MARKRDIKLIPKGSLNAEQAEELFGTVDETGHTNEETARAQRKQRRSRGHGVDIDPLSDADPSGSNVGTKIARTAVGFVVVLLVSVVALQVITTLIRRASTADLAENVNINTVNQALDHGVEWGTGFTQFPADYSVQEADENTHRIEVTVTDTASKNPLESFAGSQIQAAALAVNALLNQNINTVVYHVDVYEDEDGRVQQAGFFGLLKPSGSRKTLMTFIWSKTTTENGVRFNCSITGVDAKTAEQLHDSITSSITPNTIFSSILGTGQNEGSEESSEGSSGSASTGGTTESSGSQGPSGSTESSGSQGSSGSTGSTEPSVSAPQSAGH